MKTKILFIERKPSNAVSIEKVFRQVAKNLSKEKFVIAFQQLFYPNNTIGTIKNLLFYRKLEADIYHITGHIHYIALILPANRTVLTIHDAGILHIRKGLRRYVLKKLLFDLPIKKLKFITAVSETTKKEIIFFTNCEEEKIRVIENPLQEHFHASQKGKFNNRKPSILQIGTTANKNLRNLIYALEGINCRLDIVGELDNEIINLLKSKNIDYGNKLNLNDREIKEMYVQTDLVSFCSTFEGFGLPIIEAQAMLTPVITSNLSPMKEVAGEAAVLVDPYNPESIKNGIQKIINDENYREILIKKGIENVKRYKPKEISGLYENLYIEVISEINKNKTAQFHDIKNTIR